MQAVWPETISGIVAWIYYFLLWHFSGFGVHPHHSGTYRCVCACACVCVCVCVRVCVCV